MSLFNSLPVSNQFADELGSAFYTRLEPEGLNKPRLLHVNPFVAAQLGLSAEQLQDSLYGLGDGVESNAINVHIYNLRRKLGSEVVKTVRGLGYRIGVPREPA